MCLHHNHAFLYAPQTRIENPLIAQQYIDRVNQQSLDLHQVEVKCTENRFRRAQEKYDHLASDSEDDERPDPEWNWNDVRSHNELLDRIRSYAEVANGDDAKPCKALLERNHSIPSPVDMRQSRIPPPNDEEDDKVESTLRRFGNL